MIREIVLNGRRLSYELTRKQVKNINLRVRGDACVHVSASPRVTLASIERFMQENADRILDAVEKAKKRKALRQKTSCLRTAEPFFTWESHIACVCLRGCATRSGLGAEKCF